MAKRNKGVRVKVMGTGRQKFGCRVRVRVSGGLSLGVNSETSD